MRDGLKAVRAYLADTRKKLAEFEPIPVRLWLRSPIARHDQSVSSASFADDPRAFISTSYSSNSSSPLRERQ